MKEGGKGGRKATWNKSPWFHISSISLGVFCKHFSYEFVCPERIPARGRENKVQTVVMWWWWDQSADPITLPASKTQQKTPQATAYSAPDWGPSGQTGTILGDQNCRRRLRLPKSKKEGFHMHYTRLRWGKPPGAMAEEGKPGFRGHTPPLNFWSDFLNVQKWS